MPEVTAASARMIAVNDRAALRGRRTRRHWQLNLDGLLPLLHGQQHEFLVYADCRGDARKGASQIRSNLDCRDKRSPPQGAGSSGVLSSCSPQAAGNATRRDSVQREALTHPERPGRRQVSRSATMRGKWACLEAAHVLPRQARAYAILGLRGLRLKKMHFPARGQPDLHATGEIERRLTASGEGWSRIPRSLRPTFASG